MSTGMIFIPKVLSFFGTDLVPGASFKPSDYAYFTTSIKRMVVVMEPAAGATADSVIARHFFSDTGTSSTTFGIPVKAFEKIEVVEFECIKNFRMNAVDSNTHKLWVTFYNF